MLYTIVYTVTGFSGCWQFCDMAYFFGWIFSLWSEIIILGRLKMLLHFHEFLHLLVRFNPKNICELETALLVFLSVVI